MRVLVYGDVHFSSYSSILRKRGPKFSNRLEWCIRSVEWAEELADNYNVDLIVNLGDFFDRSELNSEEATAFSEIHWNKSKRHICLIGNHETSRSDLSHSTAHLLKQIPNCTVVDNTTDFLEYRGRDNGRCLLGFLPYVLRQEDRVMPKRANDRYIVFSHNDLLGIQMGQFVSKEGFSIEDIESQCDLFINGHLHNGQWQTNKILNLGNLTGQNFSEDATKYNHNVLILDTDTLECHFVENPYAFNFYKIDYVGKPDTTLPQFKSNSVVMVRAENSDVKRITEYFSNLPNVVEFRVVGCSNGGKSEIEEEDIKEILTVDHIQSFKDYCLKEIGESDNLIKELAEL